MATFWDQYRRVIDRFFAPLAPALPMYVRAPFESTVLRMGPNGVIIGHRPAENASVTVLGFDDLDPPLEPGWTIFTLPEPAGFRREERWGFEFRHYQTERVSARHVRELEEYLENAGDEIDVVCVVTSGDLTSIGNHVAVRNPRIRLWDRAVLDRLVRAIRLTQDVLRDLRDRARRRFQRTRLPGCVTKPTR